MRLARGLALAVGRCLAVAWRRVAAPGFADGVRGAVGRADGDVLRAGDRVPVRAGFRGLSDSAAG